MIRQIIFDVIIVEEVKVMYFVNIVTRMIFHIPPLTKSSLDWQGNIYALSH